MLNPKYNYIGIDFETTGLDPKKDEAIQIAIVKFDHKGKVLDQFESLINPGRDVKTMAEFITGITIEDLKNAPKIQDLQTQIQSFFNEKTIVIGHNISFDIKFLKKYFPDIHYLDSIDTYQLSQALVHFAPSHALEVLVEHLKIKPIPLKAIPDDNLPQKSHHDALHDTQNSISLFLYACNQIIELIKNYPVLANFFPKTDGIWKDLLQFKKERSSTVVGDMKFPKLSKISPSNLSLKNENKLDLSILDNTHRYYVGDIPFSEILKKIASGKNVILTFSITAKLNIAKNLLNQLGIKNIGFSKSNQIINHDKLTQFINKDQFDQNELFFLIKYLSHSDQGSSFLDINTFPERKIMYYLQGESKYPKHSIVLTTHGGLFNMFNSSEQPYLGYDIAFFDLEYRYKSYNNFLSGNLDLYTILNFIETLIYKYGLLKQNEASKQLEEFHRLFITFIGIIFIESKTLFTNTPETRLESNPIIGNINFHQTNKFIQKLQDFESNLKLQLQEPDFLAITQRLDSMYQLLEKLIIIQKRLYSSDGDFYFTFKESVKFTNRLEFTEKFGNHHTTFFSNYDKSCNKLSGIQESEKFKPTLETKSVKGHSDILEFISNSQYENIFILSTQKPKSKDLFEFLLSHNVNKGKEILVENITGGVGKNIFKAKRAGKKIIIGGNMFLLNIFANKLNIDIILVSNIKGAWEKNILTDLLWYAS